MAQEKSADELKRELEEIARFPDMNPGPVLRLRDDGTVLRCNLAARKLFGKNLERRNWKTVCKEMNDELWENIKAVDVVVPVESRIGERHFLFSHRTDRKTGLVFVFGTDISVNKVYEEQLEAQKAVIEEVARFPDMNPGPVLRMDLTGCITLCNVAATKLFGEDLKGQSWRTICREIDDARWNRLLASDEVFAVEAKREERHFVFHHRRDRKGKFVFVFGTDITLQKNAEAQLLQSEKMATLGTLAAGVAHELNNPAAATRRAAQQLREVFTRIGQAREKLYSLDISAGEKEAMLALARRVKEGNPDKVRDPVELADREADMESWLEELGMQDAWDAAPSLVSSGMARDELAAQMKGMSPQAARSVLEWIALLVSIHQLIGEIHEGSSRISEIVVALKNYSFLGQAPVQEVNLHEGLDNTLVILKNKLKKGIRVKRDYSADLPAITAYGSELNQVWTNILDNAADAMQGSGEITIRTTRQGDHAVIEIEDDGPGIPSEIQSRIFDPFFTTKEPGKGTGLGLSTSYGIVTEKHQGRMEVQSRPGFTRFTVRLPIEGIR